MKPPIDSTTIFTEHKTTPSLRAGQALDTNLLSRPLAIVTPWFGRDHNGGAEMHAWQLAIRLAQRGRHVEVITTCCRSYQDDWGISHLPSGLTREPEGFSVRRFPVEPRNRVAFDRVNGKILAIPKTALRAGIDPLTSDECNTFADELIKSPQLLDFLRTEADTYHAFLFLPYLYGTTLRGLPSVAHKAFLQPCLHHEAYAFLPEVFDAFFKARKILYLSDGEAELAARIYGPGILPKSITTGAGVIPSEVAEDRSILEKLKGSPFILCLGRQDKGKNTDMIAHAYTAFRANYPASDLCLIIAGPGQVQLPESRGLLNVGAVSEAQKNALIAHCKSLFHPSQNESYSRVIMEAWRQGRPVAAHSDCLATATAVSRAGAGWIARDQDEWTQLFAHVDQANSDELIGLGKAGQRYARQVADWDSVIEQYENVFWEQPLGTTPQNTKGTVHQVLPNFVFGDAISNQARYVRDTLRDIGYNSEIFALDTALDVAHETKPFVSGCLASSDTVLYHHSIGTAVTESVVRHLGAKCLIYHNITPDHFLEHYLPMHARLCRKGRAELGTLASHFPISVGDSIYNAIELAEVGFADPDSLPICVDPAKWQVIPDSETTATMADGRTNILFVGRLCPNKKQEDLIAAFACYKKLDPTARLILAGTPVLLDDLYFSCLRELASRLEITEDVIFTGPISDAKLIAYYRTAHLFWSMSEHEGFCVPLVESMWFDLPILAFDSTAVPETLGPSGHLFPSKTDFNCIAQTAYTLVHNAQTRIDTLHQQRIRRWKFAPDSVRHKLEHLLGKFAISEARHKQTAHELPNIDPDEITSIVVIKLDHIGDLLLATPTFESLKTHYNRAKLTVVCSPSAKPVIENNPFVDAIVTYDAPWFWRECPDQLEAKKKHNSDALAVLTNAHFDLVVNLRSDHANVLFASGIPHRFLLSYTNDSTYGTLITHPVRRTQAMHITDQHRFLLQQIGSCHWQTPSIYPLTTDKDCVTKLYSFQPGTVAIFTGAGIPLKKWPAVKFRELARRLSRNESPVVLVGTSAEDPLAAVISAETGAVNLCSRLTIPQLAVALSRCAVLVTNDSAPVHIAAAVNTPAVYITRPLVRDEFAPVGRIHKECCMASCDHPCGGFDPNKREHVSTFCRCIHGISVDEVLLKVREALTQNAKIASDSPDNLAPGRPLLATSPALKAVNLAMPPATNRGS